MRLGILCVAPAAAALAACGGGSTESCLVAAACCELADQEGSPSNQGADGCVGDDLSDDGWGSSADLDDNGLEDEDGVLHLKPNVVTRVPVVWVTSTNEQKVAQYDLDGTELLRVPTWGYFPNRTAVAADGSVWVTNRDSFHYIHIGVDGQVVCASDYGVGYTRAAALDAEQNVWIGLNDVGQVIKVDPVATDGTVTLMDPIDPATTMTVPKCKELTRLQLTDEATGTITYPYGLAGDSKGNVWVGVLGNGWVAKIDSRTDQLVGQYDIGADPMITAAGGCWSMYGMAIDTDDNPWFANWDCGNVVKVDGETGVVLGVFTGGPSGLQRPRAGGIDRQGHMWFAENDSHFVTELEPDGTFVKQVDLAECAGDNLAPGTLGTGSDLDGNMWTVLQNVGKVAKYTTDGLILGCYPEETPTLPLLQGPYTYSDLTGSTLDLVTSQLGRWRGRVEQGQVLRWLLVSYQASAPSGTGVCCRVRSAQTVGALEAASWTAPYCQVASAGMTTRFSLVGAGGAPLVADSPFLEVEMQLTSQRAGVSPTVTNLSVAARVAP